MHSAHEMLTRWPALEIAAKRARLQNSLHLSPGAIAEALKGSADVAGRAAAGLWRRDPSVWSADATVQKAIADRLGWMSSSILMAESVEQVALMGAPHQLEAVRANLEKRNPVFLA